MSYRIDMVDLTQPTSVTLNGRSLPRMAPGADGPGWDYETATATVVVDTPALPTARAFTVVASGSNPVNLPEPTPAP